MKTHTGGCQCGAVRFEVEAEINSAIACNCSRCGRLGALLAFAPKSSFKLMQGGDNLTEYQFNKRVVHHLFCKTCGIQPFAEGTDSNGVETVAVNVRCIDDIDLENLNVQKVDGKNF